MSSSNVDVFVRCNPTLWEEIRTGMALTCIARWKKQEGINLHLIYPTDSSAFHMDSKRIAEEQATTDIYVIADDDCLIIGKYFIEGGLYAMGKHPHHGILTPVSISDGTWQESPKEINPTVVTTHSVGGVAFVRKGILSEFNACEPNQVDTFICEEMERKGYKCGVMPGLKFNHLGAWYSVTQKEYWNV